MEPKSRSTEFFIVLFHVKGNVHLMQKKKKKKFHFYSHSPRPHSHSHNCLQLVCSLADIYGAYTDSDKERKGKKTKSLTSTSFSVDSKLSVMLSSAQFSECLDPGTPSIKITLKLVRNAKSWPHSRPSRAESAFLIQSLGDSCSSVRSKLCSI